MPKKEKNPPPGSSWDSEISLVAWLATCVSVFSFLFYFKLGDVMLYGDAVAHINIARRVFDSRTPGLLQLGTVWLPLPHLLMIPFLISDQMWQKGVGGSIPSMAGYVFVVVGMYRLLRLLSWNGEPDRSARFAGWVGALVVAANPNLIYMQTTAMGESLYLAFFIWAVLYFSEFQQAKANSLTKCGCCLAAACLTRYDGWFLAGVITAVVVVLWLSSRRRAGPTPSGLFAPGTLWKFVLIAAAGPALWLAYNGIIYRNPLEFANGPYSAKAIERRTENAGSRGHPGTGNPILAGRYFLKSAELNVADGEWLERAWVLLVLGGVVCVFWNRRRESVPATPYLYRWIPLLFLLLPIPFYALSVAYSGVPIFVPPWWPFSHYNVRYGLQLLPAFATAVALIAHRAASAQLRERIRFASLLGLFAFVIASYLSIWRATPVSLKEAQLNMRTRKQLEAQVAIWLKKLPADSTLLMYLGDHVGALEQAGIPLKQTINEGNHRVWMQPTDPDGLWERALADPARYAEYVLAFEGDPVWQAVHAKDLPELVEIHVTGQAAGILYRAR